MLEPKADESQESSYKIVSYQGAQLPKDLINVIKAPFLNSLRYGNELFKLIEQDAYYRAYGVYIDSLIARPKSVITLAILSDQTVLGWSLRELTVLHYVWVKNEVRMQGIAKALVPKDITSISHITNKGLSIWGKYPKITFNPFV